MPEERHVYLYRINCTINDKNYIGQAFNPKRRWLSHKNEVRKEKPALVVEHAMKKHGIKNFSFEIIATSKTIEDANETEPVLIIQWDSHISNGKGYNVANGGKNATRTSEWKENNSAFMIRRHAENGHPMQGKHHSAASINKMSKKKTEWWRIKRENKEEEHPTSG